MTRLRFAVHGIISEGGGSGAGMFVKLLAALLERGHDVDFFGLEGFSKPSSLARYPRHRFIDVNTRGIEGVWRAGNALPTSYPRAAAAQIALYLCQREVMRRVELAVPAYDIVLCTDAQQMLKSTLPVVSWPQSPPHTEAAALRQRAIAKVALQAKGLGQYGAAQAYYAYRSLAARVWLPHSDLYICGSHWARDEWQRFGAAPERLRVAPYLIDLDVFANVRPAPSGSGVTFLWLGRATPRKRLDLFLEAFALLRLRHPQARARIVGGVATDPSSAPILAPWRADPSVTLEGQVDRSAIATVFEGAHVLVQPSEHENFGFSVAEALAAGRPVVLGPTNGTRDYVGAAGFPFDQYRPSSVAAAMDSAQRAMREKPEVVAEAARAQARRYFETRAVVERLEGLCRELIERKSRERPSARGEAEIDRSE